MLTADAVLRSNPRYELVPLDRLQPAERDAVRDDASRTPYGILRAASGSALEARVVSADTALLFLTLAQPGPCPEYLRRDLADGLDATLGRLVLDGVLEVETGGEFRSGAGAWGSLRGQAPQPGSRSRTGELSLAAVQYGQRLVELDPTSAGALATRLYLYGRVPVTPVHGRLLASAQSQRVAARSRRSWVEAVGAAGSPWRSWQPAGSGVARRRAAVSFKLYVSPTADTLADAVAAVSTALAGAPGVLSFKVARTADGLARPDKLVAYFSGLAELRAGAELVRGEAAGCRPQGVPFTAAITEDGLLSWAIDPPWEPGQSGAARASWRTWVATRLAEYLVSAHAERAGVGSGEAGDGEAGDGEPWQVALTRLALDGVDTHSWVPDPRIFDYASVR